MTILESQINLKGVKEMKRMVATEIEYIRQIAQIHVQMLQNDPLAPRQSKMACALYEEMIQRRIELSGDFIEAKVEQNQVMAFIWAHHDKATKIVTIESLYVAPKYRHKGLATSLKQRVESWASEQQARQIIGTVLEENEPMRALNEKLGYTVKKVIMQKTIGED
ncbi:N-acetyltransferase [Staphylococcus chromogenes]|nr:GNAT family N-acetyltransferase [Staphylococcus chromogenes]PTF73475.1 GNAT family N-acetyltransferase [Staphylococcus chromogenes]PTF77374.1 GNAT family N-acetyltransferase [Staphylococcus chromogenes]PTG06375.1 GNAT family N-acetyltransferase [Staphylococcus chromogenes]PTG09904.1 GNAT family N-acetyltransferase [Staphylococcus chromogenes]